MNKTSIELGRVDSFPSGYGRMHYPTPDSDEVLDRLIEWTRANPEAKVYRHKVRSVEEGVGKLGRYQGRDEDWSSRKAPDTLACSVVDYLDVYWQ